MPLSVGHEVWMRLGSQRIETVDSIRLGHVVDFARTAQVPCPTLEWLALHPEGTEPVDCETLVEDMQRLAQARPPEHLAPVLGLIRNDASRLLNLAQRS